MRRLFSIGAALTASLCVPAMLQAQTTANPPPTAAPAPLPEKPVVAPSKPLLSKPAHKAQEKFWPFVAKLENDGRDLRVEGEIDFTAIKPFREFLDSAPGLERIVLNSPGGIVVAAELMAQSVRKRGLKTHVAELCTSACTLIFLSGTQRTMDAEALIGFHQASMRGFGDTGAWRQTKAFDSMLAKFYLKTGLSQAFVDRILATPFDDMMLPTSEELLAEKVLTSAPK